MDYEIRHYRPGDETRILETFNAVFSEGNPDYVPRTLEQWYWEFRDNPAGNQIVLAVAPDGRVICQYCCLPYFVNLRGERVKAGCGIDSFLDPGYRRGLKREGVFLRVARTYFREIGVHPITAFGYGFPNEKAYRVGVRMLKYHEIRKPQTTLFRNLWERTDDADVGGASRGQVSLEEVDRFLAALLVIVLVAMALWYLLVGRKKRGAGPGEPAEGAEGQPVPGALGVSEEPSSVKTYTYVLGDDYFDPSFSIEIGPDFYGECGIGITETIGAGDPKKVTAFEIWLFDKSDIRTVTTVLASEFGYSDPDLNEKLQPKRDGDQLLPIEPGMEIALETTALRIKARITALEYAQGNLPANSFFQKVTFELQAWVKQVEPSA